MRLRLILLLACLAGPTQAATSPEGLWWTEDHSGVIGITPCNQSLCGRIVGQPSIRDSNGQVPVDVHGVPHCGLTILRGEPSDTAGHFRGIITNPDDGANWNCEFWVGDDNKLRLRGYVVFSLLGQTQIWPAFEGKVAVDCSIS